MELGEYPFSKRYGWTQDRFGPFLAGDVHGRSSNQAQDHPGTPVRRNQCGKAEEAIHFYVSLFPDSAVGPVLRYGANEAPDAEGTVKHAGFALDGQEFAAMESAYPHGCGFNEAISFMVRCRTQKEVDHYWARLSAVPQAEECGWLKDKYGLSWQVVPTVMSEMLQDKDPARVARVTEAFLKMKKFDIARLQEAYERDQSAS
jgi:predicted 3-demethylubiquinone-9 3-methyltransferase (glyoxalase superfamily)